MSYVERYPDTETLERNQNVQFTLIEGILYTRFCWVSQIRTTTEFKDFETRQ